MNTIYKVDWSQVDQSLELAAYHDDDQNDKIAEGEPEICCTGCMYCLGLSWKDFM